MKKVILCSVVIIFLITQSFGQTRPELNADLIPKELKTNANAVIRHQDFTTVVKDVDHVIYKKKNVITILNRRGEEYAEMLVRYDKSITIKDIKAALYDKSGNLIYKIPESKFRDHSYINGFSLFEDDRVKVFNPAYSNFPYTLEFEYEVKYKNSFYFLSWIPQNSGDIAVQKSTYNFYCDKNYPVRIKEYNFSGKRSELQEGKGQKLYKWEIENLKPFKYESYSPLYKDFVPMVKIAPTNFYYEGIKGSFTNWKEFGEWYYKNLLVGRDSLPPETYSKIKELTKNAINTKDKTKIVYEYVQNKSRYVSIQVGIGGYQPMTAEQVDKLGYGDCKALTNYTRALLKAVGIQSIYTIVNADKVIMDLSADFANVEGNHVILCVPFEKDTVWLECTSQTDPFGYLGEFTHDRRVLLCTEKGGIITKTKRYSLAENLKKRTATFHLDEEGNTKVKMSTQFHGLFYEDRNSLLYLTGKERQDKILDLYPVNNIEIKKYNLIQDKGETPTTTEEFEFTAYNFGAKSKNRLFLYLNPVNQFTNPLKDLESRRNPIWIQKGYIDEDMVEYILPEGLKIETLPKNLEIKNEFGEFSCKVLVEGDKIIYQRRMLLNNGTFPAESYEKLREYYLKIAAADQQKLVLIKS